MITEDDVKKILKTCYDPEIPVNIVDLGLIYGIKVDNENKTVDITMTLTTPGCPLFSVISDDVTQKVEKGTNCKAKIELVWEPRWTPDRLSEEAKKAIGL